MITITSDNPEEIILQSMQSEKLGTTQIIDGIAYRASDNNEVTLVTYAMVPRYRLIQVSNNSELNAAPSIEGVWSELDYWTSKNTAVVIVDPKGEIRGGNLLGYDETIEKGIYKM